MSTVFIVAIILAVLATAYDYVTTSRVLGRPGVREKNRITNWFLDKYGLKKGLLLKTICVDLLVVVLFSLLGIYVLEFRVIATVFLFIAGVVQIQAAYNNTKVDRRTKGN